MRIDIERQEARIKTNCLEKKCLFCSSNSNSISSYNSDTKRDTALLEKIATAVNLSHSHLGYCVYYAQLSLLMKKPSGCPKIILLTFYRVWVPSVMISWPNQCVNPLCYIRVHPTHCAAVGIDSVIQCDTLCRLDLKARVLSTALTNASLENV